MILSGIKGPFIGGVEFSFCPGIYKTASLGRSLFSPFLSLLSNLSIFVNTVQLVYIAEAPVLLDKLYNPITSLAHFIQWLLSSLSDLLVCVVQIPCMIPSIVAVEYSALHFDIMIPDVNGVCLLKISKPRGHLHP
jgi:hypothetical protein